MKKTTHIFKKAQHGLSKVGSQEKFLTEVLTQLYKLGLSDKIYGIGNEIQISVFGKELFVRGRMENGIFKIGTMFVE